jgi:AhpD family alkylhydroperoxidase
MLATLCHQFKQVNSLQSFKKMTQFTIPTRAEVSAHNQGLFDNLQKGLGFVPNLYAYFSKSETALGDYLSFQNRKSTLRAKEREVINLVVSQVNECQYCLSAHTVLAKMNGFSDDQILEIRSGNAPFDAKLNALTNFVRETTIMRGKPAPSTTDALFAAGYTEANLVDIMIVIGDKIVSNFIHGVTQFEVDFPMAPALEEELA